MELAWCVCVISLSLALSAPFELIFIEHPSSFQWQASTIKHKRVQNTITRAQQWFRFPFFYQIRPSRWYNTLVKNISTLTLSLIFIIFATDRKMHYYFFIFFLFYFLLVSSRWALSIWNENLFNEFFFQLSRIVDALSTFFVMYF